MKTNSQALFETLSPKQQALVLKKLQEKQRQAQLEQANSALSTVTVTHPQPLPLSLNQENLWFLYQLGDNSAYHTFSPVEIKHKLHIPSLVQALTEIVRRHESLRTTFAPKAGHPTLVVAPASPVELPIVDLTHVAPPERAAVTQRLADEEATRPFDLAVGPLLRLRLLQFAADHFVLFLTLHHIVSDGRSFGILYEELSTLYQAYVAGKPSPLPELAAQYVDFANWQRCWLQSDAAKQQLAYWRQQLVGLPPLLDLPTDAPRPAIQTTNGALVPFTLPASLVQAVTQLSQRCGVTPFMTFLTVFKLILARYSQQTDIAVGTPLANRPQPKFEPVIGFFANTLVLRTDFATDPPFTELVKRVQRMTLAAYENQDLPFGEIVKALQPDRNLSYQPLFQVMFAFQNFALLPNATPAFALSFFDYQRTSAMFDLTMELFPVGGLIQGHIEYNTALFHKATIERMCAHFVTLLHGIIAQPELPISQLQILSPEEQQQLIFTWNKRTAPYLQAPCIHHLIEKQAQNRPDAPAVVAFGDSKLTAGSGDLAAPRVTLSYGELNRQADQLAAYLQTQGVGPEKIVAVCLERSPTMLVAVLGILKAGGAYVALDPEYPPERLAWTLADTQAVLLLTEAALVERFSWPDGHPSQIARVCLDMNWPTIAACDHVLQPVPVTTDSLAYIIYTSGSTGQPKGVMGTHRNLLNLLQIAQNTHEIQQADKILQMANFAFSVFVADWVRSLCTGATLVLCPRPWLLLPQTLYHLIEKEAITCGDFVPAVLRQLVQFMREQGKKLSKLRLLIVGSDSWHTHEYEAFRRSCGENTRLINAYGMTETTVDSCYFEQAAQPLATSELMPIGRPFANVQVYVFDEKRQPVPIGVPGELYIGGLGVARGYLNQPTLTREKFVANPFGDDILYRTGDRARYRADGVLEFLGRVDNQIKLRGFRIELGEIEATLLEHPAVQEAIVLLTEQAGEKQLVAYIVPRYGPDQAENGSANAVQQYRVFLQGRLPAYMVPAFFVVLDAFPLTGNGKVDRRALPKPTSLEAATAWVAPRNATEKTLAALWAKTLNLEKVSVEANFFELGGHSLLAAQLIPQIQQAFGQALPIATLFQNPTVAQLAAVLENPSVMQPWPTLVPLQPAGRRLPFFCVHGVGGDIVNYYPLAQALGPEQPFYALRAAGLDGQRTPHTDLTEMATEYMVAIQRVQPHGPYLIGGHSFGGEVAFEIVRQLQAQGETVALFVLLDSYAPGRLVQNLSADPAQQRFSEAAYYISAALGNPLRLTAEELASHAPEQWSAYFIQRMQANGALPAGDSEQSIQNLLRVCQANLQIDYRPAVQLNAPTLLCQAETVPPEFLSLQKDEKGWRSLIMPPIQTVCLPGDHFSMLSAPHVQTLACHLQTYFNQVAQSIGN